MRRPTVLALALLTLPATAVTSGRALVGAARGVGVALAGVLAPAVGGAGDVASVPGLGPDVPVLVSAAPVAAAPVGSRGRGPRRGKGRPAPRVDRVVYVPVETVLGLARQRRVPEGRPVPATPHHPAGIELLRVANLGVGLRDGDVLTEVAGAPAGDEDRVLATVVAALRRHDRSISARFVRDGAPWALVVELPIVTL